MESPDSYAFAAVKDELVLRHKQGAKTEIKAKFLEDDRHIFVLSIQGYTIASAKPHNASFSFVGDEIGKLLEFIDNIRTVTLTGRGSINISDENLRRMVLSNSQARSLVQDNEALRKSSDLQSPNRTSLRWDIEKDNWRYLGNSLKIRPTSVH